MQKKQERKEVKIYPRVYEHVEDWPIYRLSQDRDNFIDELDEAAAAKIRKEYKDDLVDVLVKTLYLERIRIKEEPWKVDPPKERQFWNGVSKRLIKRSLDKDSPESKESAEELLDRIVHRYSEEIVGTFQKKTYKRVVPFLTALFNRLLNGAVDKSLMKLIRGRKQLHERLIVEGDIETVRSLFKHGTVVVVPTHFSNLDSILVGYAMDQIMGLPSFSYGAGLNLYNFGPAAYVMNRMGAYRLDRRKKNPIYLETLKTMSELSIKRGVNSLFFPGGTRSRSGEVEQKFKLGLMGTAVAAQRAMAQEGSEKKVFIVPMVIGYHFVLEAPFLIEQYLKQTGKENYLTLKDSSTSIRSWLRFIWSFFSTVNDISLSVGRPMDVLGNFVDAEGNSTDKYGNAIDVKDYFKDGKGKIEVNTQREGEYTRLLAERLVERYRVENIVLSSHLVAFAVFQLLMHENPKLDIYGILRLPPADYVFPLETIVDVVEQMQSKLNAWEKEGKLKLSDEIKLPAVELVEVGVKRLGVFHQKPPLNQLKNGDLQSQSFRTLYYYHNRLDLYGLEHSVDWKEVEIQAFSEV